MKKHLASLLFIVTGVVSITIIGFVYTFLGSLANVPFLLGETIFFGYAIIQVILVIFQYGRHMARKFAIQGVLFIILLIMFRGIENYYLGS